MGVELRERKWCGVLGIEKVGVEGYWKEKTIAYGLSGTLQFSKIALNSIKILKKNENHPPYTLNIQFKFQNDFLDI